MVGHLGAGDAFFLDLEDGEAEGVFGGSPVALVIDDGADVDFAKARAYPAMQIIVERVFQELQRYVDHQRPPAVDREKYASCVEGNLILDVSPGAGD